jgi:hypothetical protein
MSIAMMPASLPLLLTLAQAPAAAPAPKAAAPLRSPDAILADHVKAIGGAAALGRHKTLRTKRAVNVQGMNIAGTEERVAAAGNKLLSMVTMPGMGGPIRQGSDGETFWADDPINGLRLLEGVERAQARFDATWNAELSIAKLFKTVTAVPPPAGAPSARSLECLELVPTEGLPMTTCFDAATHLRVFQTGRQATPQGPVPFVTELSDWRSYDGVKMPALERTKAGPASIEARLTEVKFDQPVDPSVFKLPRAKAAKAAAPVPATGVAKQAPAAK